MKLHLSSSDILKVQHLIEVKDTNIQVADMYLYYLLEEPLYITNKLSKSKKVVSSPQDAFFLYLMECLTVDLHDTSNVVLAETYFRNGIDMLDAASFQNNPFYQSIKGIQKKVGKWSLRSLAYQPYQGFAYEDIQVDPVDYRELSPIGFFNEPYPYLAIFERGKLWMSLIPHEIKTMEMPLLKMHGDIVVFGLGLGYFTYMAALKENVTSITVIEKDQEVIALFQSTLLPLFPHKDKITIIEDDAFVYLDQMSQRFTCAFMDIYLGANDGIEPYIRFKGHETRFPNTIFTYWLETSILAYLRRLSLVYFEEVLNHFDESHYVHAQSVEDRIINSLHHHLRDVTMTKYEQVHQFLSDDALKELAKNLKIT